MPVFKRVRDKETGHEFSTQLWEAQDHLEVLHDEPAVDGNGKGLPDKPFSPPAVDLESMTIPQLKDEIDNRNASRTDADKISPEGSNKADLIAALAADKS